MAKRTSHENEAWSDYADQIVTNLRCLRAQAGLSQEDFVYRWRLTHCTQQKYEKGESKARKPAYPTIRTLLAMSQTLAVAPADILPPDAPDLRIR